MRYLRKSKYAQRTSYNKTFGATAPRGASHSLRFLCDFIEKEKVLDDLIAEADFNIVCTDIEKILHKISQKDSGKANIIRDWDLCNQKHSNAWNNKDSLNKFNEDAGKVLTNISDYLRTQGYTELFFHTLCAKISMAIELIPEEKRSKAKENWKQICLDFDIWKDQTTLLKFYENSIALLGPIYNSNTGTIRETIPGAALKECKIIVANAKFNLEKSLKQNLQEQNTVLTKK